MIASPVEFDFSALRRAPDVEAPNLFASDATDRLLLDEAALALAAAGPGEVVVIGDGYGALTLGGAAMFGATGIRVFQDSIVGERALAANADGFDSFANLRLGESLLTGARVVLLQLPKSLAELEEIAAYIAAFSADDVQVFAGGRVKHMTVAMNDVLLKHFGRVDVLHARQKSRVLVASGLIRGAAPEVRREWHDDLGLWVCATGSTFAGTSIDIGTRALLAVLETAAPDARTAVDLGCGSGVLAAVLAHARPELDVLATDAYAGAVSSAAATAEANHLGNMRVLRDDSASTVPDHSVDLVLLNPPFHLGATVHTGAASKLFDAAARILRPGGELFTVYNSHLDYRAQLQRIVGPTRQVSRGPKFTVTVSHAKGQ